jgi:hypothetical protein
MTFAIIIQIVLLFDKNIASEACLMDRNSM